MKTGQTKKLFNFILLVLFCFLFTGCQSDGGSQSNAAVSTPAPATAASASLAPMDTLPPAATATPTLTATPMDTPTPANTATPMPTLTPLPPPFFDTFVSSIVNGDASQVVGVYVEGVLALKIVQQPTNNPGYVSELEDTATYFAMVEEITGNTGLLAHNYLAGVYYFDLRPGQIVILIYGDGSTEEYVVSDSEEYQASNPTSPTSNFVDLKTGETLTSTDLFYRVYGGSLRTTFQTCIAQGSEDSWGRLFVIAPQE